MQSFDKSQDKKSKVKIIFFGSSKYVLPIVEVLKRDFDLAFVVTTEKKEDAVPQFCIKNKIEYLSIDSFDDGNVRSQLSEVRSQLAVLADFGLIVPPKILEAFEHGILNIHPSLLPKYRGPTPVQTAILNGDEKTGVSIIKLDEKMDHGPILKQVEEPIFGDDTAESLYQKLFAKGSQILSDSIKLYLDKKLIPVAQNNNQATYTKKLIKTDGYIDISCITSENFDKNKFERMIRAYYPWPGVWTKLQIADARLLARQGKWRIVKFLPNEKIQVEGGKPMSVKDFLNGYPEAKEWLAKIFNQ